MALIQFTRNHTDHSTDKGYQFEFFCDRCGSGFRSEFVASVTGFAASALRAAGGLFGGVFGQAGSSAYEIQRAVAGPAHDKAFRAAIEKAKPHFRQCPRCSKWACQSTCWNAQRSLCFDCAPDVQTELAAAQLQATIEQAKQKLATVDMTKGLDVAGEHTEGAVARCPSCNALTQGSKFCPECGKPLRPKDACPKCGVKVEAASKFCPACGAKMA